MALKDGWTNPRLDSLLGELVFLKVESDSFYIRKANIGEATIFWNQREPQTPVVLDKDTETSGLIELAGASIFSVKTIGGKAANLAELVILDSIPLPEDFFTIPFYYYQQHIATHGFDTVIQNMLAEEAFISNLEFRSTKLAQLRQLIIDAPLDPALTAAVMNRIQNFGNFDAYKFRSSTNAEDLESFSGAGLYDSFSAKKGSSSKTVDKAIKQVWASLWNLRAFDERDYYKIDENSVAMGVLVNRSFPNEDANGVVITRNLYNGNHGYIINVQYKEYSIVYPEPGIMNDQIITYTINLDNQKYTIEYLTQSNLPQLGGQTVLTDDEIYELADYCTRIKNHYYYDLPNNCNCGYESFAVDIEFKLDSEVENRKIYIKQARIYAAD
jgi:phosphoenolpyruvate synthase/pyruvate phosphate dikinase